MMRITVSGNQMSGAAACTVLTGSILQGFDNFRMLCQAQIVVTAKRQ